MYFYHNHDLSDQQQCALFSKTMLWSNHILSYIKTLESLMYTFLQSLRQNRRNSANWFSWSAAGYTCSFYTSCWYTYGVSFGGYLCYCAKIGIVNMHVAMVPVSILTCGYNYIIQFKCYQYYQCFDTSVGDPTQLVLQLQKIFPSTRSWSMPIASGCITNTCYTLKCNCNASFATLSLLLTTMQCNWGSSYVFQAVEHCVM